jgi:hypothetical protein
LLEENFNLKSEKQNLKVEKVKISLS